MQYRTRHREALVSYLESVPGRHVTAAEICEYFRLQGQPMGTATVYRQMEKLVSEGLVQKYIIDAGAPACFEYIGPGKTLSPETCFHCKCERCGVLIHLHCNELECLEAHLREHHGFFVNPVRTVFYGLCGSCAKKAAGENEDREEYTDESES